MGAAGASVRPPHGMRVDPALLAHVASVVRRALAERDGDVLCFLPGVGEIARVAGLLGDLGDVEVLQVHGRAPAAVQDAVLAPGVRRRVVLATSVAESSLTVPGVRGGGRLRAGAGAAGGSRARAERADDGTGVAGGRAAACGAGREEAPGVVYRCWAEAEDGRLPAFPRPDQGGRPDRVRPQAACWGDPDASGLALLDPPPGGGDGGGAGRLAGVGAVDSAGRATERGARLARLGLHPRLGRALMDSAPLVGVGQAAEVVALLSEEAPRGTG